MDRFVAAAHAKVKAVNRCHQVSMEIYDLLMPIFQPLVGEKLTKVDGTFLAKFKKLVPELPNEHDISVMGGPDDYSLRWSIKCNEQIEGTHGCLYYDITTYIGKMSGGVLTAIEDRPERKTDFTYEWLRDGRKACEEKKDAYEKARTALWPFGEDRDS